MKYKLPDGFENREEAMEALIKKETDAAESQQRVEKEKRILLAFDVIKCTVTSPYGVSDAKRPVLR